MKKVDNIMQLEFDLTNARKMLALKDETLYEYEKENRSLEEHIEELEGKLKKQVAIAAKQKETLSDFEDVLEDSSNKTEEDVLKLRVKKLESTLVDRDAQIQSLRAEVEMYEADTVLPKVSDETELSQAYEALNIASLENEKLRARVVQIEDRMMLLSSQNETMRQKVVDHDEMSLSSEQSQEDGVPQIMSVDHEVKVEKVSQDMNLLIESYQKAASKKYIDDPTMMRGVDRELRGYRARLDNLLRDSALEDAKQLTADINESMASLSHHQVVTPARGLLGWLFQPLTAVTESSRSVPSDVLKQSREQGAKSSTQPRLSEGAKALGYGGPKKGR